MLVGLHINNCNGIDLLVDKRKNDELRTLERWPTDDLVSYLTEQ